MADARTTGMHISQLTCDSQVSDIACTLMPSSTKSFIVCVNDANACTAHSVFELVSSELRLSDPQKTA
jgi:hypothetical protein